MKNIIFFASIFLISHLAYGGSYQVVSLYDENGFVTERLLPFAIKDSSGRVIDGGISLIRIEKPCYAMADLYRNYIVHVYCTEEVDTQFLLNIRDNGVLYEFSSPSFHVRKVALVSSTPKDPNETDIYKIGRQLFNNNCLSCHKTTPIEKNVTPTILSNAFAGAVMRNGKTTQAMKAFDKDSSGNPFFSTIELSELVKYINEAL
ncbi:MAG: cytochrome c [Bdellovibrionaceae bacterium]|nr:cytochrome c [Pseudobdellovibrionaceae bacterium]